MRPTRPPRAPLLTALAFALFAALHANAQTAANSSTESIASTVSALRQVNGEAVYDSKIPPEVRALLRRLKLQLRDLAGRTLDAGVSANTPASVAQSRVLAALRREGVPTGGPKDDVHTFGSVVSVSVTRPRGHANLVAVTTTVSVHCGSDTSLYIFRREGSRWLLALADESNGYEQVNGARERFDFRVSPPRAGGDFFVVAADVNPWCTSNWQMMRYRVMRVSGEPYSPRVISSGEEGIYLGTDLEGFRLEATANTFTLRFDASQSLDPGLLIRAHVLKFEVEGERAVRVAPVAFKPEDFADEWARMKWDEAARWSEPSNLSELKRWHETLNAEGKGFSGSEILFVQPCGAGAREWQIGVESYLDDENRARLPPKLYFTVSRDAAGFRMRGVGDVRPPGCPGEAGRAAGGSR